MSAEELKLFLTKLKSDKKSLIIIVVGLVGVLMIMLSGGDDGKNTQPQVNDNTILTETQLADEVENFIENIEGAGKTKVILSFEAYEETVYAENVDERYSHDEEKDINSEYVIIDNGAGEDGLKLKVISPKIRGVAVICQGGDQPIVKEQIVSALSALFNISTNKISVALMAT